MQTVAVAIEPVAIEQLSASKRELFSHFTPALTSVGSYLFAVYNNLNRKALGAVNELFNILNGEN